MVVIIRKNKKIQNADKQRAKKREREKFESINCKQKCVRVCGKRKQIQTKKQMNALLDGNISITRKNLKDWKTCNNQTENKSILSTQPNKNQQNSATKKSIPRKTATNAN